MKWVPVFQVAMGVAAATLVPYLVLSVAAGDQAGVPRRFQGGRVACLVVITAAATVAVFAVAMVLGTGE